MTHEKLSKKGSLSSSRHEEEDFRLFRGGILKFLQLYTIFSYESVKNMFPETFFFNLFIPKLLNLKLGGDLFYFFQSELDLQTLRWETSR